MEPPYVIPAAPGWRVVYTEAAGLPADEPLEDHVSCEAVAAWEVRENDRGALYLLPMVTSGSVVEAEGNQPDLILEPGQKPEDFRFALTYEPRRREMHQ